MRQIKTNKQFKEMVKYGKPFIVDFYADWCGPCQSLLPTVSKLAEEYKGDVPIVKLNIDHHKEIAQKFNIRSIPTIAFIQGKKEKNRLNGMITEHELRKNIEAFIA